MEAVSVLAIVDDRSNVLVTYVVLVVVSFKLSSGVPERTVGSKITCLSSSHEKAVVSLEIVHDQVVQPMLIVVQVG